jgi:chloramphenicol 3-O-phosphotransferase
MIKNNNAMDKRPIVIILNGPTCAGKTSIANSFVKYAKLPNLAYVAMDGIDDAGDIDDSDSVAEYLHPAVIKKIKQSTKKNKIVLCDTVIDDEVWLTFYKEKLKAYKVFFVFLHSPLTVLVQRLKSRNDLANSNGDLDNMRRYVDIMFAFGRMYEKSIDKDYNLGRFSHKDLKDIVSFISETNISPRDWNQLGMRYPVFNVKPDEEFFLKLKFDHDLVVHNYLKDGDVLTNDLFQEQQKSINMLCAKQIFDMIQPFI